MTQTADNSTSTNQLESQATITENKFMEPEDDETDSDSTVRI